jgi:hypothetical protein
VLWGIERFFDEHLWLGEDGHLGSLLVQWAGIALAVAGVILLVSRVGALQRWRRGEGAEGVDHSRALGEARGGGDGDDGDPGSDDPGSDPFAADGAPTSAGASSAANPPPVASTATGAAGAERD